MPAIIVNVRTAGESIVNGEVDLHVFHPSSSGTNIVYAVKFSEKENEGCWWWPPSIEEYKKEQEALAKSNDEIQKKTEIAIAAQSKAYKENYERVRK